ncbi:MAG: glycosyltransferase family 2 protein [Geminicoccaceae bacterium]
MSNGHAADGTSPGRTALLSLVVPFFNEETVLEEFHRRVSAVLAGLGMEAELVFVDDGSRDSSVAVLERLKQTDPRIGILQLSRNFGKEVALTAGLDHARGDAVIVIDADLQDPPELIPDLVAKWREGYDVVYAQRIVRRGETWLKKATARGFYRLMTFFGDVALPENVGDFRLLSRRATNAVCSLRERHRFMKGVFTWIGYRQVAVPFDRDPRHSGVTKWNYGRLIKLAIEGLTSFTIAPLRFATYIGLIAAILAFLYGVEIVLYTLLFGRDLPGYPSLIVVVLMLGGLQLFAIGLIGEYIGRIFNETKNRPLYLIDRYAQPGTGGDDRPAA